MNLTHRFEARTHLSAHDLSQQVLNVAGLHPEMRLGIVADPAGDWVAAALAASKKITLVHIATSPAEQTEAEQRAAEIRLHEHITWEALKLPHQPNPGLCRFDSLLCGLNITAVAMGEFFAWAREAVRPGGTLVLLLEIFRGAPTWRDRYTQYRRLRSRFLEGLPDAIEQNFPTRDMVIDALQTAGFPQILVRGLHQPGSLSWSEYVLVTAR
ncbi:MAG: hypothetical protein K1Y36_07925 [Blastocatellia bacterium]|nr:hypothetical protein [Blastocatellia bacterium]